MYRGIDKSTDGEMKTQEERYAPPERWLTVERARVIQPLIKSDLRTRVTATNTRIHLHLNISAQTHRERYVRLDVLGWTSTVGS